MRAIEQAAIRSSPRKYDTVKSKVTRCIKVQKKTARNNKTQAMKKFAATQQIGNISEINYNDSQFYMSGSKQFNEDLSI